MLLFIFFLREKHIFYKSLVRESNIIEKNNYCKGNIKHLAVFRCFSGKKLFVFVIFLLTFIGKLLFLKYSISFLCNWEIYFQFPENNPVQKKPERNYEKCDRSNPWRRARQTALSADP
ncbi:hypothetical protein B6D60_06060 [candidate division KSB1 bacterium 4484_87]|nr:MAG: hypothetical protein B6D60_06060 [candidate division KSB1 bacterium 4484_87]